MAITLDEANKMVAGAIAKANEFGIKINVAVVDAGGPVSYTHLTLPTIYSV